MSNHALFPKSAVFSPAGQTLRTSAEKGESADAINVLNPSDGGGVTTIVQLGADEPSVALTGAKDAFDAAPWMAISAGDRGRARFHAEYRGSRSINGRIHHR